MQMKFRLFLLLLVVDEKLVLANQDSVNLGEILLQKCRLQMESDGIEIAMSKQSWLSCPQGPPGEPGIKGSKGEPGQMKGQKGEPGLKGVAGDPGPRGRVGKTGPKGEKCVIGPQGSKGDSGEKGDIGARGSKGDTGIPGLMGETGVEGIKGEKGSRGFPGPPCETVVGEMIINSVRTVLSSKTCRHIDPKLAVIRKRDGGVFNIMSPQGLFQYYCVTETNGENWTVIQRRTNGAVNFYLYWNDYKNGFGDITGDFWLGLEKIYQLTRNGNQELRIDMITTGGTQLRAEYRQFSIAGEDDFYRLSISEYHGNASDPFASPPLNGMPFSTEDKDHDNRYDANCASYHYGAWWYNACSNVNLNGGFHQTGHSSIRWGGYSLSFSEMKIRRRQ